MKHKFSFYLLIVLAILLCLSSCSESPDEGKGKLQVIVTNDHKANEKYFLQVFDESGKQVANDTTNDRLLSVSGLEFGNVYKYQVYTYDKYLMPYGYSEVERVTIEAKDTKVQVEVKQPSTEEKDYYYGIDLNGVIRLRPDADTTKLTSVLGSCITSGNLDIASLYSALCDSEYNKKHNLGLDKNQIKIGYLGLDKVSSVTSVSIPDNAVIYDEAFKGSNIESVDLSKVTDIGSSAFLGCTALTSVILPKSINIIRSSCFKDCTKLTTINLDNISYIQSGAFENCSNLDINTLELSFIGKKAFKGCGITGDLTIKCSEIQDKAFRDCTGLTSVTYESDIKSISSKCFDGCTGLSSIKILDSVEFIGSSAFKNTGLSSIYIPESVKVINDNAFEKTSCQINYEGSSIPDAWDKNWYDLTKLESEIPIFYNCPKN